MADSKSDTKPADRRPAAGQALGGGDLMPEMAEELRSRPPSPNQPQTISLPREEGGGTQADIQAAIDEANRQQYKELDIKP